MESEKTIMKILITGNMGYIGPCVVKRFRSSFPGARLIGYDMGYFADCVTNSEIFPVTLSSKREPIANIKSDSIIA